MKATRDARPLVIVDEEGEGVDTGHCAGSDRCEAGQRPALFGAHATTSSSLAEPRLVIVQLCEGRAWVKRQRRQLQQTTRPSEHGPRTGLQAAHTLPTTHGPPTRPAQD
ncbi:hypothetical protein BaRGS_00031444 [Batillaria attramentaria]|uniref:Uncharacterized protein n=1 Tax=Batillaria attramentaria TaxID=370345 RepID=A0ABD0JR81_9CAEN